MTTPGEDRPAEVDAHGRPKQAGETRPVDRDRVERSVWTDRMLAALEKGVKGGVWFSLIDKVWRLDTLRIAFEQVKANRGSAGVDHQGIGGFEAELERNLSRLQAELRSGTYRPRPVKRVWIEKPGKKEKRPLGIPAVRDRVVQAAVRLVIEPIFEREFVQGSYGFRPGLGCKDALREVDRLLKCGHRWVVDADLKSYFDSIPQDRLMAEVERRIADGRLLALVRAFLRQPVMDGLERWTPERGTPQGAVLSPLLANIYLHPIDRAMAEAGYEMVRYADDFVILCRTERQAREALDLVESLCGERGLTLHPEKTRLVDTGDPDDSFDFLGYRFQAGRRWPRPRSIKRLRASLRPKTKRTRGDSLPCIIADVNRTLRGWFEYFKHSRGSRLRSVDGWVRRRLRSILRARMGLRGISRGRDHQRWPNDFFRAHGLFTLEHAHAAACQPGRG